MKTIELNGIWSVRPESLELIGTNGWEQIRGATDGWIEARVPGEIHLDLNRSGQMPEPSVGANVLQCRWPETKSWWYRTSFEVSPGFFKSERRQLVFDGLDLYAQVFLNGGLVGEATNAFIPAIFDVANVLQAGRNELVVRLTAGSELVPGDDRVADLESRSSFRGEIRGDIAFPREWTLFGPVAKEVPEPMPDVLREIPSELAVGGARLAARKVCLQNNRLDLGASLGGPEIGKTVYMFTEILAEKDMEVTFGSGLDYWMKWWVNGQVVCSTTISGNESSVISLDDHCFSARLRKGRNVLAVKAVSGSGSFIWVAGGPRELSAWLTKDKAPHEVDPYRHRNFYWEGRKWLRKPQIAYGADWVAGLPNIGIWRGVRLEGRSHAVLHDLRLDTVREDSRVCLEMEAVVENLHPWSERAAILDLEIQSPDGGAPIRRRYALDMPPGRLPVRDIIEIPDARLWWPNGLGDQPLYRVTARVNATDGTTCDTRQFSIGLRTIEIDRSRLSEGSRFCFRVNGQDVFCRGANLQTHDIILARVSDEKYDRLIAEARNANMNMFRINGCNIYEQPAFYNACDRAGILVWQDFLFTCSEYPDENAAFSEAVRAEAESVIPLLRHHPCIAVWCGNNECTQAFYDWHSGGKPPRKIGGAKFYSQMLPEICRQFDPRRPYWPGSPCGGIDPHSELEGDCHWYPFMDPQMDRRIRPEVFDESRTRFSSEHGVIGPCHLDSIKTYLAPEEIRPDNLAWRMHTNTFEKDTIPSAIRRHYADPEDLSVPEYVLYGQMFQAIVHGHAMEAFRFRKHDPKDDCQGALIYSYSDCWGETGWSILDYYLRRKASYYWFRRASRLVKVIVRKRGERFITRLVNDTPQAFSGAVEFGWWRLDGSRKETKSQPVAVEANRMREVVSVPAPPDEERDPRQWLYAAVLRSNDGGTMDQSVLLLQPFRDLALAAPEIKIDRQADGSMEVSSPVFCHGVHVEDHGFEVIDDNWFDLLPGVVIRVRIAREHRSDRIEMKAVMPVKNYRNRP